MKAVKVIVVLAMLILAGCEDPGSYGCDSSSPDRVGAVRNDGTRSSSVGSGTCSSHGGVDHWICN